MERQVEKKYVLIFGQKNLFEKSKKNFGKILRNFYESFYN